MSTPSPNPESGESSETGSPPRRMDVAFALLVAVVLAVVALAGVDRIRFGLETVAGHFGSAVDSVGTDPALLARRAVELDRRLTAATPRGKYLVVSSSDNRFTLLQGTDTLRTGLCSTGSYVQLTARDGRTWLFVTPRGRHAIRDKRIRPVWAKPDWAFIEAGEPVPAQGAPERFESGVLGNYALSLGDGYLIHGTPYQRLLGMPVTHGCVRLGDEDLEVVFRSLSVGSTVFLY